MNAAERHTGLTPQPCWQAEFRIANRTTAMGRQQPVKEEVIDLLIVRSIFDESEQCALALELNDQATERLSLPIIDTRYHADFPSPHRPR
jgi:hypothetical protein